MSGGHSANANRSNPQASPTQMLNLYSQYLPQSLQTTVGQTTPTALSLAQGASAANPLYTQSGLDQLNGLAGGYQQAGANLATAQAQSQANLLAGAGGQTALNANALSNYINPAQAASNRQATNLVNSINLGGLSPGEQMATERSLNQSNYATGNLGLDNATNAVSNAMNFGNALSAKRAELGNALSSAGGVAANQNSFVNPVQTALNAGNTSGNFGLSTFNPTQANSNITAPLSFGSSLGNQIAGVSAANKSSGSGSSTNLGCFLTTACCEYKGLPDDCEELTVLRNFRDTYVPIETVKRYYIIAPDIADRIRGDVNRLEYVYSVVKDCVSDIKSGRTDVALKRYTDMVIKLA